MAIDEEDGDEAQFVSRSGVASVPWFDSRTCIRSQRSLPRSRRMMRSVRS